jgi:amino acid transporter
MILKRWLVGLPLKTKEAAHERLSKRLALAVFSSDALSSVAYATEEILLVLTLAGTAMVGYSIPLSLSIIGLLIILTMSYRQIIFEYPEGGGAYIVGKSNLGEWPGLVAAAALMIDYVLTVAVSVAAGMAALTSAVPALLPHREALCVAAILLVTVVNLRGVRESGQIFAVPTYIFIATIAAMLGVGAVQILFGHAVRVEPLPSMAPAEPLTLFLLLRAFSSGCTALTGVEVISNGVSAFKKPEPKNAAFTMIGMAAILGTMFIGISAMAYYFGIVPKGDETVVSQIAHATFGTGPLYFLVQASTMVILILAANSSFNGFPRLASILARDSYMPHQMSMMGDRLVFSNGVIILGVFSCLLIVLFNGDTHALIPLYAVGVFLSFTISQAGMVKRWLVKKGTALGKEVVGQRHRRRDHRHRHIDYCQHQVRPWRVDRHRTHPAAHYVFSRDPLPLQGRLGTGRAVPGTPPTHAPAEHRRPPDRRGQSGRYSRRGLCAEPFRRHSCGSRRCGSGRDRPGGNPMGPVGLRRTAHGAALSLPVGIEFPTRLSRTGVAERSGMLGHGGDPGNSPRPLVAKYSAQSTGLHAERRPPV